MGKILFFDVDGTLLDFSGNLPESARKGLALVRANGHQVVICTGRSLCLLPDWLLDLSDGLVGSTGAYVSCRGQIVYEHIMPLNTIRLVKEVLDEADATLSGQAEECVFLSQTAYERTLESFHKIFPEEQKPVFLNKITIAEDVAEFRRIKKIIYRNSTWEVERIREKLGDICDVTASSFSKEDWGSGEITCKGINKAFGMQKYLDALGMGREDTVAFGDGPNDFEMLDFAGVGVAMGNARESLKAQADLVTTDINDDGIYNALKILRLI